MRKTDDKGKASKELLKAIFQEEKELKKRRQLLLKEIKSLESKIKVLDKLLEDEKKLEQLVQIVRKKLSH